jgi:hypothetical protein
LGTGVTLTRSTISFSEKQQTAHLHPRNGEIIYNAWNMWSSGYFAEIGIFDAGLFCTTFCIFQSASSPKGARSFLILEQNPLD